MAVIPSEVEESLDTSERARDVSTLLDMTQEELEAELPLQNFSDNSRIRFAFRQLDHLSLEKV